MALSLGPSVDRLANVDFQELPVGKWVVYGVAYGLATAIVQAANESGAIKPYLSGPAIGLLAKKIGPVRNTLGETFTEALAITGGVAMLDQTEQINLFAKIKEYVDKALAALGVGVEETPPKEDYGEIPYRPSTAPDNPMLRSPVKHSIGSIASGAGTDAIDRRLSSIRTMN